MFSNRYFKNILWLFLDKIVLLIGGFLVTALVARFLGPQNVGVMNFGLLVSGFASVVSQHGASHTVFNKATSEPGAALYYLNSTLFIRLLIYFLTCIFCTGCVYFLFEDVENTRIIFLFSVSMVFTSLDLYQFLFNGTLNSKYNAIPFVIAKVVAMLVRVMMIYSELPLLYFALAFLLEGMVIYFGKRYLLLTRNAFTRITEIKDTSFYSSGTFVMLSGVLVYVYSRINQVFLSNTMGFKELGLYSAALALSMAWTFIPNAIGISIMTKAFSEDNPEEKLTGLAFTLCAPIFISIPVLFIIWGFANEIILFVYGADYVLVYDVLFKLSLYSLLSVLVFLSNRFISKYSGSRFLFFKTLSTTLIGIFVCYVLVGKYGLLGAVYSVLIVESISLTLNLFFNKLSFWSIYRRLFNLKLIFSYFKELK